MADTLPMRDLFNKVVDHIRADFPADTKNIVFVDLADVAAREKIALWFNRLPETARADLVQKYTPLTPNELLHAYHETGAFAEIMPAGMPSLVGVNSSTIDTWMFTDPQKQLVFSILHETGHILTSFPATAVGMRSDIRQKTLHELHVDENAADNFATMYGRHAGLFSAADAIHLSTVRALHAWLVLDVVHLTSLSLEGLHLRHSDAEFISLSRSDIKLLAAHYAKTCSLPADDLQTLKDHFEATTPSLLKDGITQVEGGMRFKENFLRLVASCAALPHDHAVRKIGARAINALMGRNLIETNHPLFATADQLAQEAISEDAVPSPKRGMQTKPPPVNKGSVSR